MFNLNSQPCGGTRYQPGTILIFNQSNKDTYPEFQKVPGNREIPDRSKNKYLEKSIRDNKKVFQPILITEDGKILDGQTRDKIVKKLWNEGLECEISVYVTDTPANDEVQIIRELQKGSPWTPEEWIKSQAELGNEYAKFIYELSKRSLSMGGKPFGVRNSLILVYGGLSNTFVMPDTITYDEKLTANKLFNEIDALLSYGQQKKFIQKNNWVQSFVTAWRRIRTNQANTQAEKEQDGEYVKTVLDTKVLNNMIKEVGIEEIGYMWPITADFSSSRIGRWVNALEVAIISAYDKLNLTNNMI